MVEDVVEGNSHVCLSAGYVHCSARTRAGGGRHAIEKSLRAKVMVSSTTRHHRIALVSDTCAIGAGKVPTGKDARELVDCCLRVRGNGRALGVELRRTVEVQLVRSDREQLQDFASKVFVRICSRA